MSTNREWMYMRTDEHGIVTRAYAVGLHEFMTFAGNSSATAESGKLWCPCTKCRNRKFIPANVVYKHLYDKGFMPSYYIWFAHGEVDDFQINRSSIQQQCGTSTMSQHNPRNDGNIDEGNRFEDMVHDAFPEMHNINEENQGQEPNIEAQQFYQMLEAAKEPLYDGCGKEHSRLSVACRMMTIKTDHNLTENCMDEWAELVNDILPEGNNSAESYYEIQKLVYSLGLPSESIDVCIDNCMLYWRNDVHLLECKFCGKPRFKAQGVGRTRIPYQRMWYLPITDRLKRLYQSDRTASSMRWHYEHVQGAGEMVHPSDGRAWKHFQSVHPNFSAEPRNVYLGLCTDGFSPFGMSGRQYSLWPVIITPYNLPPGMCMEREFLFLNILVPGPKHPKRSLDVFLQPLIAELKELWYTGSVTFDISRGDNFIMRAMLLWTISDFPAYGMLSGWTTHGRLSCPYCCHQTDAFQLKNGRKSTWFDCHRRFLPANHRYRRNKIMFKKNVIVRGSPPVYFTGTELLASIEECNAKDTVTVGGNGHSFQENIPEGYGEHHNWHKRSIFWELPYWADLLLRHNLDLMHIEKNFFDNLLNTILNVPNRTKDNIKSRLDLPDICAREELHLAGNGKAPVPIYRLSAEARTILFQWIVNDVKFPDGYVSKLSRTVEQGNKFSGMKSHDCHVFMQRLLPFAFSELLPSVVHEAVAGIAVFFRDICSRTLKEEVLHQLETTIPIILCNLEKLFPPSFFDVMEHLPIHLPHEAILGGPVQFRWMYPFERFMKHLKNKAKNLARVEGSIVAGSLIEETTHFTSYYFGSNVRTRKRGPRRYDDGGVVRSYGDDNVPNIFSQVGRLSGKLKETWWDNDVDIHCAQNYILYNCEYVQPFESLFMSQVQETYPGISMESLIELKDRDFADWLSTQVQFTDTSYPQWFRDLVLGPKAKITKAHMYFTRGYAFHTLARGETKATTNYGVCVKGESDFYGILKEIIEVEYPGMLGLKCVLFKCDWYDPIIGRGTRTSKFGIVDVNVARKYDRYEPFILASQAEQVCYIPYPRLRETGVRWAAVIKVTPRGYVIANELPLQQDICETFIEVEQPTAPFPLISSQIDHLEDLENDTGEESSSVGGETSSDEAEEN